MIRATLNGGERVILDRRYGDTTDDLHAVLTADSLTGSAVPLADVPLVLADGRTVPYSNVETFTPGVDGDEF